MEKDSNGVILEVGQLVAFNHSGAVRLGRIEKLVAKIVGPVVIKPH